MRRSDKEIRDFKQLESIIGRASVMRLALFDDPYPYLIPVNFGYQDGAFYFHSAEEGRKLDLIRRNNRVCLELEAESTVIRGESPCKWSTRYESVIGFGRAFFLEGTEDKRRGLEIIFRHYTAEGFEVPLSALARLAVIKIEVDALTGKVSPAVREAEA